MQAQLKKTLATSRSYTLSVAEAMPDNLYNSKPAGAGWNFRELMHHIAYSIRWWETNYIKGVKTDWAPPATKTGKKDVIAYLNETYDGLAKTIHDGKLSEEAIQGFYATIDHIAHHRGQAVLHLRVQSIEPPEYVY